ncbi:tetratricopeptide repeat protein [Shewanella intestini]|uniref:Tetratricopeptide repeat protein n=1 Tax=Shewanella intestini TaxID=2017544 RepID=A0ABS5I5U4_9GAMM|nr:hypothetical protein [Shewanella intestini]MRG37466.1 hypothetical protein [Shewanella sp. XMDDZSB0408]
MTSWLFSSLLMVLLSACQSNYHSRLDVDTQSLFLDEHFIQQDVLAVKDIFALPDEFKNQVRHDYLAASRTKGSRFYPNIWLANYVGAQDGLFQYQDHYTRSASVTALNRLGNCMSLVVLSAAIADEFDIDVEFQDIEVQPVWDKRGGFYLVNGHVNLKLLPSERLNTYSMFEKKVTVDFLPERTIRAYKANTVSRKTLVAMFYNNVAAESLVKGDLDLAYALIKKGIQYDVNYLPAMNTLAVIYRHKALTEQAELVYRIVLQRQPQELTTLFNLSLILGEQGRLDEWHEVHKILELARINNPFYYYDMAQQAYLEKQFQEALMWYKRAVAKADYRHEFYFGLSRAYWATGDEQLAKKHLQKALALSTDSNNKQRYQLKLKAMQAH